MQGPACLLSGGFSFELSNRVWEMISEWENFKKWTLGKQFIEAVDSVSANIAEGYYRHFKKDKINFYRYSRGSVGESIQWTEKARIRGHLSEDDARYILDELNKLPLAINKLIQYTETKLKY